LKYLDCVIKESMRILTPVPIYDRIISEDIEIGFGLRYHIKLFFYL